MDYHLNLTEFELPIELESDSEYVDKLDCILHCYQNSVEKIFQEQDVIEKVKENINQILLCVEYYYNANIYRAQKIIKCI